FKLEITGDGLQGLAPLAGSELPAGGPVALSAGVKGNIDNPALENIKLNFGQSDITGILSIDLRGQRPRLEGSLSAAQIDITELLPSAADPAEKDTDKLFPSDPLPLDSLNILDANIDLSIAKLVLPGVTLADTKGVIVLDNGALTLAPIDTSIVGSAVAGNIEVDARGGPASVSIDLKAPQLDLGELLREVADVDKLRGGGAVDISLRGAGGSVAEIMSSLNGHSRLLMDEGEIKNDFLGTVSGLTQTIGEAFGKKDWILVECIASDFDIVSGIANSRINVINTELLLISTDGNINLSEEKPDLKITPQPKGIDLSLAVPVNVGGSLANPTYTPDTLATAKKIGGILGAIAFPPAAIIGLGELGSSDNPCLQSASAEETPPPAPNEEPASPVDAVTDAAKDALEGAGEDIGKGLKKIFGN
ncbi:MAG: AsmA family protein, partial [Alphaproteobacteria bacterium]|nr:AsmA family protein [Alphaproteobacteria bacterium]